VYLLALEVGEYFVQDVSGEIEDVWRFLVICCCVDAVGGFCESTWVEL
jgi:hypothetical protein